MLKDLFKEYILPGAVFGGGMIGVGFLSLPYILTKVGLWTMLFYFIFITGIVVLINFIFCEISLKTPDFKRFPGFVGYYLGKWPKAFSLLSLVAGSIGVLLVYLLVAEKFLGSLNYVLIYFLIASIIIYLDIKIIAKVEFLVVTALILFIFITFLIGFSHIRLSNVFQVPTHLLENLFLPYGPLLFALWGVGLVPEIEEMLGKNKKSLKKLVVFSTVVISILYLLFTILIVGLTGRNTDQSALLSLTHALPRAFVYVALFIGVMATFVAFISQGIILKKTLIFDMKIRHWQAFVMTCLTPLILFLLGISSFVPLISFVGGVFLGINGILILLMYKKIGGKGIIIYSLSLVFLLGVIYEIIYFIK